MSDTDTDQTPADEGLPPPASESAVAGQTDAESLIADIRERAFQISLGPDSGTQEEDWLRAKREILAERAIAEGARRAALEAARDDESSAILRAEIQAYLHP